MRPAAATLVVTCLGALGGCGSVGRAEPVAPAIPRDLQREARPIGLGPGFHLPARGPVLKPCHAHLGSRFGVHVEVFAQNRVVLIPAGIGTRPPRRFSSGRIFSAGCYGAVVTLEPTGVVMVRTGAHPTLASLFRSWGQPLSATRVATFAAPPGSHVMVYIGGTRWKGPPGLVALRQHAEIVVEVGPYVPPHRGYTFPPGS